MPVTRSNEYDIGKKQHNEEIVKYENCKETKSGETKYETLDSLPVIRDTSISSNNSSRNSTISSQNWMRRSFEDLDLEVVQTETMQTRKRKRSRQHHPSFERKPPLSLSSSSISEDFQKDSVSDDVSYVYDDSCIECRRMFGQAIDELQGTPKYCSVLQYPCDCPIAQMPCCESCCSSCSNSTVLPQNENMLVKCTTESNCNALVIFNNNYRTLSWLIY